MFGVCVNVDEGVYIERDAGCLFPYTCRYTCLKWPRPSLCWLQRDLALFPGYSGKPGNEAKRDQ